MKGLITKDLRILLQRKRSLILIILLGLVLGYFNDGTFVAGWLVLIGSILSLGTITYDEYDNCYPFMLTMPISRKTYAVEKYVFGMMCSLFFWLLGVASYFIIQLVRKLPVDIFEGIASLSVTLFVAMLILDTCIPFSLKYGSQRSRIIMLVIFGAITAISLSAMKTAPVDAYLHSLDESPSAFLSLLPVLLILTIAISAVSVYASIKVMTKKEF